MKKSIQATHTFMLLAASFLCIQTQAQVDPHFSQYYIQPMTMNPALTGAIEGDYRVSGIWRSQYSNTLVTEGVSGEVTTDNHVNVGVNLLNQSTNDKVYNYTNGYLTMAYNGVRMGYNADKYLVMALQGGFINRRFDVSKLQSGSQWAAGLGYNPAVSSNENFSKPSISSFDAGAGIAFYDAASDKKANFFGGFSAFHITRPPDPYLSNASYSSLEIRYCLHAGVRITASDRLTIVPTALFMKQGDAEEKMLGAYFQIFASENADVLVGANYRINDAVVPFAGLSFRGLTFGLSYDVNASNQNGAALRGNSMEMSISFTGHRKGNPVASAMSCPRF